jgi:hypothetical protein
MQRDTLMRRAESRRRRPRTRRFARALLGPVALGLVAAALAVSPVRLAADTAQITTEVRLGKQTFDLAKQDQLQAFVKAIEDTLQAADDSTSAVPAKSKAGGKKAKADKSDATTGDKPAKTDVKATSADATDVQADDTSADSSDDEDADDEAGTASKDKVSKTAVRCLKAMRHTAKDILKGDEPQADGIKQIQEINWAMDSETQTPVLWRSSLDIMDIWLKFRYMTLNPVGRGNRNNPAQDLVAYNVPDLSKVDPKPSSFWVRPDAIPDRDLYHGFDRSEMPDFTDPICEYGKAHSGYGAHGSFDVLIDGERYKAKFGEEHSEPFGTRILWAMGFPALITDYTPEIKVKYDRRMLLDFNNRKPNQFHLKFLGIPVYTFKDDTYIDPFQFVVAAVLKDGSRISGTELRQKLFVAPPPPPEDERPYDPGPWPYNPWLFQPSPDLRPVLPSHPDTNAAYYDSKFEQQIDYLVMRDVNMRPRKQGKGVHNIGFWDYNFQDHPKLREVRGLGILNAWLDNWDIRWGNTRLQLVEDKKGNTRVESVVSDMGALWGNSTGFLRWSNGSLRMGVFQESPNSYAWRFTNPLRRGQTSVPIKYYMPLCKTQPFYEMNIDDARWAARLIGQLSENQIKQGLIGAGCDAASARLLLEKLVARRDQMIADFGLQGEISFLRLNGVADKHLSYDPKTDPPFTATVGSETITARMTDQFVVVNGKLEERAKLRKAHAPHSSSASAVQSVPSTP